MRDVLSGQHTVSLPDCLAQTTIADVKLCPIPPVPYLERETCTPLNVWNWELATFYFDIKKQNTKLLYEAQKLGDVSLHEHFLQHEPDE